ncbi:MAG: energy-coupled thiamine transporter ThiT [Clostridiales bacterium]|nr:energy-coupled thiamine transporter ThiT [Clostridiales bacterium]
MKSRSLTVAVLAEGGIAIALSFVLSLIRLWHMPQGGSVTAGHMVPLILFALRRGPVPGMLAGLLMGLLTFFKDPYFLTPVQFLLDYPIPYALLGLAGFFSRHPIAGTVVGVAGRFLSHVLSGAVFFAEYAGTQNPWIYSIIYNGSYLLPDLVITAVLVALLWPYLRLTPKTTGAPS